VIPSAQLADIYSLLNFKEVSSADLEVTIIDNWHLLSQSDLTQNLDLYYQCSFRSS